MNLMVQCWAIDDRFSPENIVRPIRPRSLDEIAEQRLCQSRVCASLLFGTHKSLANLEVSVFLAVGWTSEGGSELYVILSHRKNPGGFNSKFGGWKQV